ncbi:hypothetical protein [Psychrobacillus sp. NPDC093180]|uniref:hyaluronate lyase N-terminal domain-containing protein n=1 Tax=Psychrobacillus sp. NPDC093180 TaxID=3364489 RepID=UPI00380CFDFA
MARKVLIQVRRGLEADLGILADGELGFCTDKDNKKIYIGSSEGNILLINAETSGDMTKSIYDTNNDGVVDRAKTVVGPVTWGQLKGV